MCRVQNAWQRWPTAWMHLSSSISKETSPFSLLLCWTAWLKPCRMSASHGNPGPEKYTTCPHQDENVVKVVCDLQGNALYFSRSPLPYPAQSFFWEHVGLYGFQKPFLLEIKSIAPSKLEKAERLEQLRVIGKRIQDKSVGNNTFHLEC